MKALKIILGLISLGLTVLYFINPSGSSEYSQALFPLALPLIGMGVGILGNLLSGSGRKRITRADLIAMGWKPYDAAKAMNRLARREQAQLKQSRAHSTAKARSLGIDPVSRSNYGNEAGIHEATQIGYGQIEDRAQQDEANMTRAMLEYNLNVPEEESTLSKILGGAVGGANLGLSANTALGVNIPDNVKDTLNTTRDVVSLTDNTGSTLRKFLDDRPDDSPVSGDALRNRLEKEKMQNILPDDDFLKDIKLPWKNDEVEGNTLDPDAKELDELPNGELSQILGSTLPQWAQWNKINPRGRKPFLNYLKDLKGSNIS